MNIDCFYVLAARNIGVYASLSVMVFSVYMPSSGIVGHIVVLFLVF